MRRITLAAMTTVSGLVLLFSYHTSRNEHASTSLASGEGLGVTGESTTPDGAAMAPLDPTPGATGEAASADPSVEPTAPAATSSSPSVQLQAAPAPTKTTTTAVTKRYLGAAIDTRYGPVQVQITVRSGKIIRADVTQVPMNNGHDRELNTYAVPLLNAAAVTWQTADLQSVSGATYTSEGYKQSLQSAIDKAGL